MNQRRLTTLLMALLATTVYAQETEVMPPKVEKKTEELTIHGDARQDEYYWLRERENPQVIEYLKELQRTGVAPAGDPAMLFNMIRACAGALLALSLEIRDTSGIDFDDPAAREELANMIIAAFMSGEPTTPTASPQ